MEAINTFQGEPTEDKSHIDAMVAKAEGAQTPPPDKDVEVRPEGLPEKFKSVDDLLKAYTELEKKLGNGTKEPAENDNADVSTATTDAAAEALDSRGLDFNAFQQEFMETGTLSDAAYDALEKAGIPAEVVDSFIDGQMAVVQNIKQDAYSVVGGEAQYAEMIAWAKDSLSEGEVAAFNKSLDTRDINQAKLAIRGLAARYRSEVGKTPNLIEGQVSGSSGGAFRSLAEVTQAMRDPRYAKDPAFRQDVANKLSRSNVF